MIVHRFAFVALVVTGCGGGLGTSAVQASYQFVDSWTVAGGRSLHEPFGISVDPRSESVLVADVRNRRVVVFGADGGFRRALAPDPKQHRGIEKPTGLAVAFDGSVYVADYDLDRVQRFAADGEFLLGWGRSGEGTESFRSPNGLAIDGGGRVYVADFYNKIVKVYDADGRFQRAVGRPGQWGSGALDYPTDVDLFPDGRLLVADAYNHRLQLFSANGEPLAAWGWHLFWLWPRPAEGTRGFDVPTGVAVDPEGRFVHVADSANHRVVMLDQNGKFVAEWKIEERRGAHNTPVTLAASPDGRRIYATDIANDRVLVLEVRADE